MTDKPELLNAKGEPMTNQTNSATTTAETKEIDGAYRKFLRLYDHFVSDRLIINKQSENLQSIIDELKAEASLAAEFKSNLRQDIADILKQSRAEIKEQIKESATSEIAYSINRLNSAVDNSAITLRKHASENQPMGLWAIVTLLVFCGIVCFCSIYTARMIRDRVLDTYESGVVFNQIWSKLSKKERDRLLDIKSGVLPPEEKSIDWYRKKYPRMNINKIIIKANEEE